MDHSTASSHASHSTSSLAIWAGILTLYIVWGSTYIAIRVGVETIPPFLMAGIRFVVAGAILLAWESFVLWRQRREPTRSAVDRPSYPSAREWRDSAIVGAALLFGGMGFVALGEKSVPAGIAAILIAMLPVWVAVFGRLFYGERLPAGVLIGIVIGLVGVVILVAPLGAGNMSLDPLGVVVLLLSPMFWSIGSLFASHGAVLPRRPLMSTALQMFTGGWLLVLGSAVVGELHGFDPAAVTWRSFLGLAYLTTVGSLIGFATYAWLLQIAPLAKIATYAYVNPVVAFILAAILLGEAIEPRIVVAGAIIVVGVALIVTARGRTSSPAPARRPERATAGDAVSPASRAERGTVVGTGRPSDG